MNLPDKADTTAEHLGAPLGTPTLFGLSREPSRPEPMAGFRPGPLPDDYLESILRLSAQAPCGLDREPWHFVIVRDPAARERLRGRGGYPSGIAAAPVFVIAFTPRLTRTCGKEDQPEPVSVRISDGLEEDCGPRRAAGGFPAMSFPAAATRRHVQMALTTMSLVAEAYGVAATPVQGFDAGAVRGQLGLPPDMDIVALIALGFSEDNPSRSNPTLLPLHDFLHAERYGCPWVSEEA